MMRTRTKRIIWIVVGLAILYYLALAFTSQPSNAATLSRSQPTYRHGIYRTTERSGFDLCGHKYTHWIFTAWPEYKFVQHSDTWPHPWQYTFGPWSGSFCSNGQHIWDVDWGGEPKGSAAGGLGWVYDAGYTHIRAQNLKGASRYREWVGKFHVGIYPVLRTDYPWLRVDIGLRGYIDLSNGCGC